MRTQALLALGLALAPVVLSAAADWPSCDAGCKSCGLYCNEGCAAPLDLGECNRCLYCRRESSSCGFVTIQWTSDPPDPAYCALCSAGCHCRIDARCYDDDSPPPPGSSSSSVPPAAATAGVKA
ncbi:hypothetical protein F4802DRAFT_609976 [Xylaria palmicola]|nr:hypothetical protein F4802DRAFT_609976 [Xylaria palmicola]